MHPFGSPTVDLEGKAEAKASTTTTNKLSAKKDQPALPSLGLKAVKAAPAKSTATTKGKANPGALPLPSKKNTVVGKQAGAVSKKRLGMGRAPASPEIGKAGLPTVLP